MAVTHKFSSCGNFSKNAMFAKLPKISNHDGLPGCGLPFVGKRSLPLTLLQSYLRAKLHNTCVQVADSGISRQVKDPTKSHLSATYINGSLSVGPSCHQYFAHMDIPSVQVADFGISRVKDPTKSYLSATNNNGTPMYMAPEQFNGTHLDEKVFHVPNPL